jgi:hypothetical protein|tara:strand:+ start:800 stop:1003 length:204 start_codon:yes stop_codon:yes gene_type:complete
MNETAKFDIEVQLTGEDGNAFGVMAAVVRGMRKAGATPVEVAEFQAEAMSGDYDNLLRTAMRWVVVL